MSFSRTSRTIIILAVILLVVMACTPRVAPEPVASGPEEKPVALEGWEVEWAKTLKEARNEETLVIAGNVPSEARLVIGEALKKNFGLELEVVVTSGTKLATRLETERRAGLYLYDIVIGATTTAMTTWKPAGFLQPLGEIIFLPQALDPKAWYTGEVIWVDKERHMVQFGAAVENPIIINTNLVKREEIKSYRDLLDPRWKGRIVMGIPDRGQARNWFYQVSEHIMDMDYMRQLARQEPMLLRDENLIMNWIAREKYPLGLGVTSEVVSQFMDAGAPIDIISPVEGISVSPTHGVIIMLKNAPHPNAAKLFANWILTREGGTVWSKGYSRQSARVDVPVDHLSPKQIRQPGGKYYFISGEEDLVKVEQSQYKAKEIFGHLVPDWRF